MTLYESDLQLSFCPFITNTNRKCLCGICLELSLCKEHVVPLSMYHMYNERIISENVRVFNKNTSLTFADFKNLTSLCCLSH